MQEPSTLRGVVRKVSGAGLVLVSCLTVRLGHAEDSPQDRAQVLFNEGLRLMQSDHCQDALAFFSESQSSDPAAATLANLATCYARLGKTGSAYSTYRLAARAAILENKPELRKRTDQAALALAPTLTQVRIMARGVGLPEIRINGQLVDDVRMPIPLDPGENIIEATAPGQGTWRRVLSGDGAGTLIVVEVPDLNSLREPSRPRPKMLPQPARSALTRPPKRTDLRPYALVVGGVGLVAIGVGTAFTLSALSKRSSSNSYCDGRLCTQPGIDLRDRALSNAQIATWAVGFGFASLGAAATLWLLNPIHGQEVHSRSPTTWVSIGQSNAVFGLEGRL